MNLMDRINNKNLRYIAETLSDNGYNPNWEKNDRSGDWLLGVSDGCESIIIPSHKGFGEMVMDCFINDCDKSKEIDYVNTRWEMKIFVKERYNNLSEDYLTLTKCKVASFGDSRLKIPFPQRKNELMKEWKIYEHIRRSNI